MTLLAALHAALSEGYTPTAKDPKQFSVDYYVETKNASRARFTRVSGLNQIPGNGKSETAVLSYLRRLHPGTQIQINDLKFI